MSAVDDIVEPQSPAYADRWCLLADGEVRWCPHLLIAVQARQRLLDETNSHHAAEKLNLELS